MLSNIKITQDEMKYMQLLQNMTGATIVDCIVKDDEETLIFDFRIDADYVEPQGGFRPVKVTYVWEEGGVEKRDVHIARKPEETYTITCGDAPVMRSLIVGLHP